MTPTEKKRYFAFVAKQSCVLCGSSEVQVCHYQGMDGHMLGRGRGKKAHDLMVLPACHNCHSLLDNYKQYNHEDLFTKKLMHSSHFMVYICTTIIAAQEAGVLTINKVDV